MNKVLGMLGRERLSPRRDREWVTCFANISPGKLLVLLDIAECTAHEKCTTSLLAFDFSRSSIIKRQQSAFLKHSGDIPVFPAQHSSVQMFPDI